jgi:hypothetical protein
MDFENLHKIASETQENWVTRLQSSMGEHYHLFQTDHLFLLSGLNKNDSRGFALSLEDSMMDIDKKLLDAGFKIPERKDVVLCFQTEDTFREYVQSYQSQGLISTTYAVLGEPIHIASWESDFKTLERNVVFQLIQNKIMEVTPLSPAWLRYGMVSDLHESLQIKDFRYHYLGALSASYQKPMIVEFENYKRKVDINDLDLQYFWNGNVFREEGDKTDFFRSLATILFSLLAKTFGFNEFRRFILEAKAEDGGKKAAEKILDLDLKAIVENMVHIENEVFG